jgi:PDZ domain-containing protein
MPPPDSDRSPRPLRNQRNWVAAAVVLAVLLAGVVSFTVPIPIFYTQLPGPIRDVEGLVQVEGRRTYSSEGRLYMTTVTFDTRVTLVDWVVAALDPRKAVVDRDQITQGMSFEEIERLQIEEMKVSQSAAEVVAATALGSPVPSGDGAYVESVVQEPAKGRLRAGDRIVGIDGAEVATICDLYRLLGEREPGDEVDVEVMRGNRGQTYRLETASNPLDPGRAVIGIVPRSDYEFAPGFEVEFDTGRVAGPSAGLMLSLGLYDKLTPDDLTRGQSIAGTGTITCDGSVGPIGGIEQKIAAAEAVGAEVFLAPAANAPAARSVAEGIEIVEIETFDDAVEYLEGAGER